MDEQKPDKKPGTFTKGDPRINRKGRPKSFDGWRKLLQSIMNEPATDAHGNPIIVISGDKEHIATNAEMFARDWMKDRKGRRDFAANVYGKPPEKIEVTGKEGEPLIPKVDDERFDRAISTLADALRKSVPGAGAKPDGEVDAAE